METKVDSATWVRVTIIVAIIGCLSALGAAFIGVLPDLLKPNTETPKASHTPTPSFTDTTESNNFELHFSDNFNSGTSFNQNYWTTNGDAGCNSQLKNGQAELSSTNNTASIIVCLISAKEVFFEEIGSIETKISTSSGATGDNSIGTIELSKGTFGEGSQNWIIQCGLLQKPNQSQIELFFNVNSTYPQGESEAHQSIPASAEHWYMMKLEVNPETNKVTCYADGKVIGTYEGNNLAELRNQKIDRHFLGYWSANSHAIFYADDVKFSPPK